MEDFNMIDKLNRIWGYLNIDRDCQVKCVSMFNLSRMEYFSTRDFWL
jgi:hypothetical protein